MKRKIFYVMVALAIIAAAALLWNSSYQVARFIGIDHHLVDVACSAILAIAFYPAGKATEKKEDYA